MRYLSFIKAKIVSTAATARGGARVASTEPIRGSPANLERVGRGH